MSPAGGAYTRWGGQEMLSSREEEFRRWRVEEIVYEMGSWGDRVYEMGSSADRKFTRWEVQELGFTRWGMKLIGWSGVKLQGSNPGSLLRSKSTRHERCCEAASECLVRTNPAIFWLHNQLLQVSICNEEHNNHVSSSTTSRIAQCEDLAKLQSYLKCVFTVAMVCNHVDTRWGEGCTVLRHRQDAEWSDVVWTEHTVHSNLRERTAQCLECMCVATERELRCSLRRQRVTQ